MPHAVRAAAALLCPVSFVVASFVLVASSGCARSQLSIDSARQSYALGELSVAREGLTEIHDRDRKLARAVSLDLAMVELAAGDRESAQGRLRQLRDQFDAQPKLSLAHEATAILTDDNARVFRPAGYEEVMIRAMLAVCSLAGDGSDAEAYSLQASMKQSELARQAEQRGLLDAADVYQPLALAPYLRGILREATHRDYDDAARAYQLVSAARPQFAPAQEDIARASGGVHSAAGNGVLYVIGCVGRGPVLQETTAPTTSAALSIASAVLNAETNEDDDDGDEVVLPNIAQVKIPTVVVPESSIAAIGTRINGELFGATQTLTDVTELAVRQTEAEQPYTIARAVVRRVTKEATVAEVGDSLGLEGSAGSLFHFAAASAWSGAEKADTRCWGLLPREIQVLRAELPAGRHHVALEPLDFQGQPTAAARQLTVEIENGRNRYIVAIAPDRYIYLANE